MSVTLHTSKGDVKIQLHCEQVPRACENFLALAAAKKYDGTVFHRIVPDHCVQGGDPTGTGKKSRSIWGKRVPDEIVPGLDFSAPGVVAFANAGAPSATGVGCQFFLTSRECKHLDGTCTVFGHVIYGLENVTAMTKAAVDEDLRPREEIRLEKITIHANPIATA